MLHSIISDRDVIPRTFFFSISRVYFPAPGHVSEAMVTGVVPSSPQCVPSFLWGLSIPNARRFQRILLTSALALSASLFSQKKNSLYQVYEYEYALEGARIDRSRVTRLTHYTIGDADIIFHIVSYHVMSYHKLFYLVSDQIRSDQIRYITSYHIISYHIISYHIISYHIVSYHIVSYHIISYHIISYHIISYHIMSYHVMSCHVISCRSPYGARSSMSPLVPRRWHSSTDYGHPTLLLLVVIFIVIFIVLSVCHRTVSFHTHTGIRGYLVHEKEKKNRVWCYTGYYIPGISIWY